MSMSTDGVGVATPTIKQSNAQDGDRPREASDSTPAAKKGRSRQPAGGLQGLIAKRVAAATKGALAGPNQTLMNVQKPVWKAICDRYFRLEITGWERLPEETSLLIGNHSGGSLTMDAWTFCVEWWRRFGSERILHGTAHDVLMAVPGLGDYFRQVGVIPASRQGVTAALSAGCDVIIWPGGDVDSMRSWRRRDEAVLGGGKGFSYVRRSVQACRSFPWPASARMTPYSSCPRAAGLRTGSSASRG